MSTTPTTPGRRRRPQPHEFHLPDGRRIVVALPEEAAALRQKYSSRHNSTSAPLGAADGTSNEKGIGSDGATTPSPGAALSPVPSSGFLCAPGADPDIQVEVVLHGSEEHHNYLRESQAHHERRRAELRERHGPAFDEWEDVHHQLDAVSAQLDRLTDQTARLNANFSKFGYDAQLRTYDGDDGSGSGSDGNDPMRTPHAASRAQSVSGVSLGGRTEWEDSRVGGETIKLFKRPVIKQYFHKGLLWRSNEETQVMSFELFFDLLYVGIIHVNGEHISDSPDGHELLRFVVTFIMSWKIWSDITQLISWFETDDVFQRFEILFQIVCLLGFTTNMTQSFYDDPEHNTYTQLVAFYLAARLFTAFHCALTGLLLPLVKGSMISQVLIIIIPSALWIGSIHVEMPNRLGLIFTALALDTFGSIFVVGAFRYGRTHANTPLGAKFLRFFDFYPAINIEHKVERTNAFVSLVFGYSVVGVLFQNYGFGINAFLGKAILGLMQAYFFNWLYFEVDGANIHVHAIRRRVDTASVWQFAHLPFIMGYIIASAALSKLVLASDTANADPHTLTHHYEERSEHDIANGIRFFYCHGLAIALLGMGAIAASHEHKIFTTMRVPKIYRLANRAAVCLILFLLPMAHGLKSVELISLTMGLVAWVLFVELVGKSCRDDPFIGGARCNTKYRARCSKRELERAMKDDGEVDVVELGKREKTAVDLQN